GERAPAAGARHDRAADERAAAARPAAAGAPLSGSAMAHALVTGAAGFIGSTLTDRLLAQGVRVTGVDAVPHYYHVSLHPPNLAGAMAPRWCGRLGIDLAAADLGRLPEVDVVFHQAAQPGVRASWGREFAAYAHHNVLATQRLLERYRTSRLERFVYASSSSV